MQKFSHGRDLSISVFCIFLQGSTNITGGETGRRYQCFSAHVITSSSLMTSSVSMKTISGDVCL